jgi:transposase
MNYSVGIDISSETFAGAVYEASESTFSNNTEGFPLFEKWLKANHVNKRNSIIVMEATGVYTEGLCLYLHERGFKVCIEHPHKVKRAFSNSPRKNDIVDARQIAEYCHRFKDQLHYWQPPKQVLEEVRVLLTTREQLVIQVSSFVRSLYAIKRKNVQNKLSVSTFEELISDLKQRIKSIDKEIKRLINSEIDLKNLLSLLISIPGVGMLLVANLMVVTKGFKENVDAKKLSSYLGICPYEFSSGTSVKKLKKKSFGHSRLKKLIYLASMCVCKNSQSFRTYFMRKVAEGKSKRLVINNISNKIIRVIVGVVKSGKPFMPNYISVNPAII